MARALHAGRPHLWRPRLSPDHDETKVLDRLESWIRGRTLPVPQISPRTRIGIPPDVPTAVTLYRMCCLREDDGSLWAAFLRPDDQEHQRVERSGKRLGT